MLVIADLTEGSGPEIPLADLPEGDRRVWEAVGGGDVVRIEERSDPFWARLFMVGEARRSQFDALRDLGREGWTPFRPMAFVARTGRGFHGHRDRTWVAAEGNLHLCIAAAPKTPVGAIGTGMTMLPAVAVVDAIRAVRPELDPGIKWVNDILLDGAKVSGVLTATQVSEGSFDLAVLGIGVNVAVAPEVPPTPFVPKVTDLGSTLEELLPALLNAVAERSVDLLENGPGALLAAYREASVIEDRRVRIYGEGFDDTSPVETWPEPLTTGLVTSIEPDLTLRLAGVDEPVTRGRLVFESAF
jgi:biotin-(acetyl-CoA carboxylase) ligase